MTGVQTCALPIWLQKLAQTPEIAEIAPLSEQAGMDEEHTRGDSREDHSPERSFKGANSAPQNTSQTEEQ